MRCRPCIQPLMMNSRMPVTSQQSILSAIKVLDITRIIAGPLCTQWLADMGATVYKIERPGSGDDMRHLPAQIRAAEANGGPMSSAYASVNRGKRSLTVDITTEEGRQIIYDLAAHCDVFVENYKGGNMARLGLDYENIRRINPSIVYCSITAYGQDGPLASQPGYDPVFQATSGIMSTCGRPDDEPGGGPMRTTIAFVDVMTGMTATTAVMGALYHKLATGEGQFIDLALLDVAITAAAVPYGQTYLANGVSPARAGNESKLFAPSGCFRCASDRYILIQTGNDLQWRKLCEALGRQDWLNDPRYATNEGRRQHRAQVHADLEAVTRTREAGELAETLREAGIPCGPVNDFEAAFDDPQVRHRELRMTVDHPVFGPMDHVRSPLRFSQTPVKAGVLSTLGGDTHDVLCEVLGYDDGRLDTLKRQGVI